MNVNIHTGGENPWHELTAKHSSSVLGSWVTIHYIPFVSVTGANTMPSSISDVLCCSAKPTRSNSLQGSFITILRTTYYVIVNVWTCTRYGKYHEGIMIAPECYHNSWGIFLVARTSPYINEFITQGNRKMNADRDGDEQFSSALPLTRSNRALSRSLFTMYKMGKPWDKRQQTAHSTASSPTCSNSVLSRSLTTIFMCVQTCYKRNRQCYERDCPCYEHHTPVVNFTPCYEPVARGYSK